MAALDVGTAMQNVKTMLSNLTAWQTICGAANASEAALRIYEGGIEETDETLAPVCFLDFTSLPTNWLGNRFQGRLTIEMRFELAVPIDNQTSYADQFVWVWDQVSDLLAGINGAVGGSGGLMADTLEMPTQPGRIDPHENKGRCEWGFILALSVDFL
jgi:hypothetical protein